MATTLFLALLPVQVVDEAVMVVVQVAAQAQWQVVLAVAAVV
jgi:hypothetical protein